MTTTTTPPTYSPAASDAPASTVKVLIADKFETSGVEMLREFADVTSAPDLKDQALVDAMARENPDVLVVRSTKVPGDAIRAADQLALIVRAGAGFDNIDVATASSRGIFVANCPGKNAIAVAELTLGLIISCDRRIPDQTIDLRAGKWQKKEYSKAQGLYGRTIGIVGLGAIGLEVAKRARGFGMKVMAWSRSLTEERADELGVGYCSQLINLAKMSDIVSVNVAATPETQGLISRQFVQSMPDGAYLINTSRGSVLDEQAVIEGVKNKGLRLGLDVYCNQPAPTDECFEPELAKLPGVYGTHHVGASTEQAQQAIAKEAVRIIRSFAKTGEVPNCVNRAASTVATNLLTVRHLNRPGVLAHVFYTLGQAGINVEEMENIIYEGEEAACARIQLATEPTADDLNAIRQNDNVLSLDLTTIPGNK